MARPEKICKQCGKETKYTYSINGVIYCDDHKELGMLLAEQKLSMDAFRDRLRAFARKWNRPFTNLLSEK